MSAAESLRLLGSVIMFGVVAELDELAARVRVDVDGLRTDWLPWTEHRAGPSARTWLAPDVGEQVVIACPYGDPSQGVVIGSVYRRSYPAPARSKAIHRTTYPDGSVAEYDSIASRLTVNIGVGSVVVNCATVTVNASESVELNTPTVHATGDLNVDGNVNARGEVKAGSIGLKAHHHTAQGATAPTTAAQV